MDASTSGRGFLLSRCSSGTSADSRIFGLPFGWPGLPLPLACRFMRADGLTSRSTRDTDDLYWYCIIRDTAIPRSNGSTGLHVGHTNPIHALPGTLQSGYRPAKHLTHVYAGCKNDAKILWLMLTNAPRSTSSQWRCKVCSPFMCANAVCYHQLRYPRWTPHTKAVLDYQAHTGLGPMFTNAYIARHVVWRILCTHQLHRTVPPCSRHARRRHLLEGCSPRNLDLCSSDKSDLASNWSAQRAKPSIK